MLVILSESFLSKRTGSKFYWSIFAIGVLCFITATEIIGQIFFINRTESMPTGIYIKTKDTMPAIGDIIIFKLSSYKTNLIKYVAGIAGAEYCLDETNGFWINGIPVAQKNIQKYPEEPAQQSICQRLKPDELLVLGEHENSYDSRYFGPIKKEDIVISVKFLWPK